MKKTNPRPGGMPETEGRKPVKKTPVTYRGKPRFADEDSWYASQKIAKAKREQGTE